MPRKPRLHVPGGLYHVILRGNDRQAIYFSRADRRRWMRLLGEGIDRYRCRVHAYCWMTNHVHMAVQVSDVPLHRLMHWLAMTYSRQTNQRLGRTGHLFERRYRSKLVDADSYLLELVRYIHLNPVKAPAAALNSPTRGQVNFPHRRAAGRGDSYTRFERLATRLAASFKRQLLPSNLSRCA